jgi:cysteine-rich repeat protein
MSNTVLALAANGTDLYAGGEFWVAGGMSAPHIAKWDGTSWSALGTGMNNTASALAVNGTDLYVAGSFTTAGGIASVGIARWSLCGNCGVDSGEQCDDGNTAGGDCCSATCQFEAINDPCASDGETCTADACDGAGVCTHPAGNAGATCRASAGICDVAEQCDGSSTTCPADDFVMPGTPCRAASGECDVAESCTGLGATCPSDGFVTGGTSCMDDADVCTTDQCNGAGMCVHPDNGTCENSSVNLPPGGTISSDTENDGATPSDPVETSITVPGGGTVSIEERPFANSPDGFFLLGNEVEISAPNATAANPLVMAFRLDASVLFPQPFGQAEIDVGYPFIFKDSALVANCTGAPGVASPDPCVESRVLQGDGDVIVTILTSTASLWQFAVPTGECPDTIDNGCMTGFQKAFLLIKENVPGKEKLIAKLGGGPALAQTDLGNPLSGAEGGTGTRVSLCIYDGNGNLAGELVAAGPTSTCTDGAPCWKSIGSAPNDPNGPGKGYAYKDTDASTDGLQKLLYKGGDAGKPKAIIKAKGSTLPLGVPAALQSSSQATIQLRSSDGECLSAAVTEIKKREAEFFKGK